MILSVDYEMDVAVVGGGACGMVTALRAARDGRLQIGVFERSTREMCNTEISSGSLAAGGTRFQRKAGIVDSWQDHAADILRKNHGQANKEIVEALCQIAPKYVEWLHDEVGHELELAVESIRSGHTVTRLHTDPERAGGGLLVRRLRSAIANTANIAFVDDTPVVGLQSVVGESVEGLIIQEREGQRTVRSRAVVLACDGFGANANMVRQYLPDISGAEYIGVSNNRGDGIKWGLQVGAGVKHMGAYQGHGQVVAGYGTRVSPAIPLLGGIVINCLGRRFVHEDQGYSEFAGELLRQPGGWAIEVWDEEIMRRVKESELMRESAAAGAFVQVGGWAALSERFNLPRLALEKTITEYESGILDGSDPFGNEKVERSLVPPLYAAKITGALAHTQGGLIVNTLGEVLRDDGDRIDNLYAGGGTAAGVSGDKADGYLSGNGLLSAVGFGYIIGNQLAKVL